MNNEEAKQWVVTHSTTDGVSARTVAWENTIDEVLMENDQDWYHLFMRAGDAIQAIVSGGIVDGKEMEELAAIYREEAGI